MQYNFCMRTHSRQNVRNSLLRIYKEEVYILYNINMLYYGLC